MCPYIRSELCALIPGRIHAVARLSILDSNPVILSTSRINTNGGNFVKGGFGGQSEQNIAFCINALLFHIMQRYLLFFSYKGTHFK